MNLRTLVFWPHLIAGVLSGIVIFMMSVTGVLLTYERQLVAWSDSHLRSTRPVAGAVALSVEDVLRILASEHPDLVPTAVTVSAAADAPVTVSVPQRTVFVDAYSGRVLGEGSQGVRRLMSELRAWHRWIAVTGEGRPLARAITGWSNVVFSFIVLSGLYLWLPRKWTWKHVKPVVLFAGAHGKARDFNWHNVIGIWSAVPLFIVVVSAIPISFPWGNALVYRAVGERPPAARGGNPRATAGERPGRGGRAAGPERSTRTEGVGNRGQDARSERRPSPAPVAGLDALFARARQQEADWRTINLRLPESERAPAVFAIDRGDGGQPHLRSTLTLGRTGEMVTYEAFSDLTLGRRIRNVMRFAHTGEVLGIPGQTVAGLVSAGGAVLVWTGLALAWRRLRAWLKRRSAERREPMAARNPAA